MENNTKICVYAICKNESKFIDRWVTSLKDEADYVVVLDTGSDDDSVEKLKKYEPFVSVTQYDYVKNDGYLRFDKARNDSLKLVPFDADICVVLDLDQVPRKGWSKIVRDKFNEGYTELQGYIIDHSTNRGELCRWRSRNVHKNSPFYIWDRIIHEGIQYYGYEDNKIGFSDDFIIDHYPDDNKDRSQYRSLLEYACKEYPKDPYYGIYLGIELSRRYSVEEACDAFRRCINECDFTGYEDIKYQCYLNLASLTSDSDESLDVLDDAMEFGIHVGIKTRRIYKIYADIYERIGKFDKAIEMLEESLISVESYSSDWKDDQELFSGYIEDRLSLFYYYKKNDYLKAIEYCIKAIKLDPTNERLNINLKFYYEKFEETRRIENE